MAPSDNLIDFGYHLAVAAFCATAATPAEHRRACYEEFDHAVGQFPPGENVWTGIGTALAFLALAAADSLLIEPGDRTRHRAELLGEAIGAAPPVSPEANRFLGHVLAATSHHDYHDRVYPRVSPRQHGFPARHPDLRCRAGSAGRPRRHPVRAAPQRRRGIRRGDRDQGRRHPPRPPLHRLAHPRRPRTALEARVSTPGGQP